MSLGKPRVRKLEQVNDSTAIITARNSRNSPLLRLPAELRNTIYTMVIGGNIIVFCGPRYHCPDCKAKRKNFGRHCPADVLALTKVCRQTHLETFLLRLETNTFCGQAQDIYLTIDRYFWTKVELDAFKSIWAVDGTSFAGFSRFGGLNEVIVSATKAVGDFGKKFRKAQGLVFVDKMKQELGVYGIESSHPIVRFVSEGKQGDVPGIAWELSPTPSDFVCRRCGMTGHWIEDCPDDRTFLGLGLYAEYARVVRERRSRR